MMHSLGFMWETDKNKEIDNCVQFPQNNFLDWTSTFTLRQAYSSKEKIDLTLDHREKE